MKNLLNSSYHHTPCSLLLLLASLCLSFLSTIFKYLTGKYWRPHTYTHPWNFMEIFRVHVKRIFSSNKILGQQLAAVHKKSFETRIDHLFGDSLPLSRNSSRYSNTYCRRKSNTPKCIYKFIVIASDCINKKEKWTFHSQKNKIFESTASRVCLLFSTVWKPFCQAESDFLHRAIEGLAEEIPN